MTFMHVLGLQHDIEKILPGIVCCIRVANEGFTASNQISKKYKFHKKSKMFSREYDMHHWH